MPARTRMQRDTGFGGFTSNPAFRSVDLPPIGEYDAPTTPQPSLTVFPGGGRTSGTHTVPRTPAPTFNSTPRVTDPSGAGLTPSRLTGETLRSLPNQRWTPDARGSASADVSGVEGGVEWEPTFPSGGGRSPPLISDDPNDDWIGDPTARTTRSDGLPTESGMGDEPVLFDDREPSGGPVQRDYMANFGGDMTLGSLLSTPLAMLNFGGHRYVPSGPVGGGLADTSGATQAPSGAIQIDPQTGQPYDLNSIQEATGGSTYTPGDRDTGASGSAEAEVQQRATQPASQFGNLNSPTGVSVYRDAQGNYRPTSTASSDIRWSPDNPHNSNYAVSKFHMSPDVMDWGHGMASNDMSSAAVEGRFLIDEEGAPTMQGRMYGDPAGAFRMSQKSGSPKPYSDPASVAAFNAWQMQQPEYIAWMKKRKARGGGSAEWSASLQPSGGQGGGG